MRRPIRKPFCFILFFLLLAFYEQAVAQTPACTVGISAKGGTNLCQGQFTLLQGSASFNATSWQWYRDEQEITGATAATYEARQSGNYTVKATGGACSDITSNSRIDVTVTPEPNTPAFSFTPNTAACAGTDITFSVTTPEADVAYTWDFGDGTVEQGNPITHAYASTGNGVVSFNVQVYGTRQGCNSAPVTQSISVSQTLEVSFTERKDFQLCVPDTVNPDSLNVFVVLANTTQEPSLSDITGYTIDWGDGNGPQPYPTFTDSLTSPNPYQKVGDYPIIVTATSRNGCPVTFEQVYSLSQKPKANFTLDKQPAETPPNCTPIIVSLGDSSTGGGTMTHTWEIKQPNNGGYSIVYGGLDQDSLQIRFEVPGVFNIQLIVENGCGSDTTDQSVIVGYPQIQLPQDVVVCGDTVLAYNAQNTMVDPNLGQISKYEWFLTGPNNISYQSAEEFPNFPALTRPGVYTISARVTNDCGTSDDIGPPQPQTITVNPVPGAPVVQDSLTTCAGDSVTITPTGPAGANFEWYDQENGGTLLFSGTDFTTPALTATTTYYVQAVSALNCISPRVPVTVTVAPAIADNTITAEAENICSGDKPAAITGSVPTGGVGKYNYKWESSTTGAETGFTAASGANDGQNYTPANITTAIWFRRIVTTASCGADTSAVVQISVNPGIENNTIAASQEVCAGTAPDALAGTGATPTGGNGTFEYLWESSISGPDTGFSPAAGANSDNAYTPPVLTQDTWFRRLVTSGGCTDTSAAIVITVTPVPPAPALTVRNATACLDSSATLTVRDPNSAYTYEWYTEPAGGAVVFAGPEFRTPPLTQPTTYYVQAVNGNGCASSTRAGVEVAVITPVADAGADVTIIQHRTIELRASGGVTYVWEPATGLNNPTIANPIASPDKTTTYTVTVTTEEGCAATDEVTVTVIPAITVPNAFSPNHDGVNEIWEIGNIQNYPEARVEIFNRWGNIIYTSNNGYGTPWDGTFNGKELPVATYYYIIYLNASEKPISGNVTLIR